MLTEKALNYFGETAQSWQQKHGISLVNSIKVDNKNTRIAVLNVLKCIYRTTNAIFKFFMYILPSKTLLTNKYNTNDFVTNYDRTN